VHRLFGQEGEGRFTDRAASRVESAAAVTVRIRTAMSMSARGVLQAGQAAQMAGAWRLGRDGLIPVRTWVRLMVWSVPSGTATGRFEVHSILSLGG
jgi:hypothetical protein